MIGDLAMRRLSALVLAFAFVGISFSQQTEFPKPEVMDRVIMLCEHNWEHCKKLSWKECREIRLRMLSAEKECLENSQSYDAFRDCIVRFLLRIGSGS
jgi:hypothetical protein